MQLGDDPIDLTEASLSRVGELSTFSFLGASGEVGFEPLGGREPLGPVTLWCLTPQGFVEAPATMEGAMTCPGFDSF